MQYLSIYVRELHAIVAAVQQWRHYLLCNQSMIGIDQKSLRELMNQVVQTLDQHYYLTQLLVKSRVHGSPSTNDSLNSSF